MSEKNPEGKFQCTACDYGHGEGNGKSRQGVIKHHKKSHTDEVEDDVIIFTDEPTYDEPEGDDEQPPPTFHETSDDGPQEEPQHVWLMMDVDDDDEPTKAARLRGPIRDFLKGLRMHSQGAGSDAPMSAAELRAERQVHHRLLTWAWMGLDRLYTLWGRMMLGSKDYTFEKSTGENSILATASLDSLAYHGIDVNRVLNPDVVLAITVGSFYGPETVKLATRGKAGGRSLLSRIPLIGRLFRKKKVKGVRRFEDESEGNHGA